MIIDVHAHCGVQKVQEIYIRAYGGPRNGGGDYYPLLNGYRPPRLDTPEDIQERLRHMDLAGVQMQVISNPGGAYYPEETDAREAATISNDSYATIVRNNPDRFAAYGTLPLPHVQAAVEEAKRCIDNLGMVGVAMAASIFKTRSPLEEAFDPIFEVLNERGAALYLHPSGNGLASPLLNEWDLTYSVGAPMEDTAMTAHFMARAIPIRYPNIKIVVAHFGGAIPMILKRMDHEAPPRVKGMVEKPSTTARRMYYDSCGHGSIVALQAAVGAYGADRIMAGSDFGIHLNFEPEYVTAFSYIKEAGLSDAEVDGIFSANAIRILGLKVPV